MGTENLFHVEIADGVFLISSDIKGPNEDGRSMAPGNATANSYLIVGKEKALLYDLAVDEPNFREYVEKIVNRPLMVVIGHAHVDHVFGMEAFSEIWIHPEDIPLLSINGTVFRKIEPLPKLHLLVDGDQIDLGDRVIEVIHVPGHTPGSILLQDRLTGILLSGDTGARRLLYGTTPSVSLEEFCKKVRDLQMHDFSVMYSAHDRCPIPKSHLDLMVKVLTCSYPQDASEMEIPGVGSLLRVEKGCETDINYFGFAMYLRK